MDATTYVLALLLPLVVGGFAYARYSQKKKTPAPGPVAPSTPFNQSLDDPVDGKPARPLSPIDAPMIQTRFKTLGIYDALDPSQLDRLKRLVMEHCRDEKLELWWGPLQDFATILAYSKGSMPAAVVEARCPMVKSMNDRVATLAFLIRDSGLQFLDVRTATGEAMPDREKPKDGKYQVNGKYRENPTTLDLEIKNGAIDVEAFTITINQFFAIRRFGQRLLLLPPQGTTCCFIYCPATVADRAERSRWGKVGVSIPVTGH